MTFYLFGTDTNVETRAEIFQRILAALSVIELQFPNRSNAADQNVPETNASEFPVSYRSRVFSINNLAAIFLILFIA